MAILWRKRKKTRNFAMGQESKVVPQQKSEYAEEKIEEPEIQVEEECAESPLRIDLSREDLQRAFIYTEVFGKPLAKRRVRWRG